MVNGEEEKVLEIYVLSRGQNLYHSYFDIKEAFEKIDKRCYQNVMKSHNMYDNLFITFGRLKTL